jgi:Asp-tRNA(Asn)/Glu-tRNA(Gln) amidotransferase A subunit family amidase
MSDILSLSISQLGAAYRRRELSPVDVTEACLTSIEQTEPALHAWVDISAETARAEARVAENEMNDGVDRGPLHGVPVGVRARNRLQQRQTRHQRLRSGPGARCFLARL